MDIPHFCNACVRCCSPPDQFSDQLPGYDPEASYDPNPTRLQRLLNRRERLLNREAVGDELEQLDAQIAAEEMYG